MPVVTGRLTCQHFMAEGIYRSTIKRSLGLYQQRGTVNYNTKSGRIRTQATAKVISATDKLYQKYPNCSVRDGALKVEVAKSTFGHRKVHT